MLSGPWHSIVFAVTEQTALCVASQLNNIAVVGRNVTTYTIALISHPTLVKDLEQAETLCRSLLEKSEKAYGTEATQTVSLTRKLVLALSGQGKYAEEEATRTWLLEVDEKVLGKRHPETLRNLGTLASVLRVLGNYDEAEEKSRLLLERQEAALGRAHP